MHPTVTIDTIETLQTKLAHFPDHSRVWIYQASSLLTTSQIEFIVDKLESFTTGWESHGVKLQSASLVAYQAFLIFCVNEEAKEASGCSIDKSTRFVQEVGAELKINFFDRTSIAYFDHQSVLHVCTLEKAKTLYKEGVINGNNLIFNNLITSKADLFTKWQTPLLNSWVAKFI